MWKIYFFGAGKKGKYWLQCLKGFGALPAGFIDNNQDLQESIYEGLPVYSPDSLKTFIFDYVVITCNDEENIYQQLLRMGIAEHKIISGYHKLHNYLFYYCIKGRILTNRQVKKKIGSNKNVLFDLQNGMVLGGVESWVYELAGHLKERGFYGTYLTVDGGLSDVVDQTYPAHVFQYHKCTGEKERAELCVHVIEENLPCTVICNFPQYIFWSACIVRHMYPEQVRIVAVQHNDDRTYYEAYGLWQEYIDRCIGISQRIEEKLLSCGMDKDKIMHIDWQIFCDKELERTWSKENFPLQIGYAGRVTVTQKRVDLIVTAALKLKKAGIAFRLNIAGTGVYSEELCQKVQEDEMGDCINIFGYIARKDIADFWRRQDIMISCSEWEGHSISQTEAMAAGAVPVITDVSGAKDDVTDGYNGFVVPVGDVDSLVERICYLYYNRDELERMGKCAHDKIYECQKNTDQTVFWDRLLKEVWES